MTGHLAYKKVLGTKNPSDVLTKHVPADLLSRHLETMGVAARGGRAEAALELNSLESVVSWYGPLSGGDDRVLQRGREHFAVKVECGAVPSRNRGRSCLRAPRTRFPKASARGGAMAEAMQQRPRWADMTDEEVSDA